MKVVVKIGGAALENEETLHKCAHAIVERCLYGCVGPAFERRIARRFLHDALQHRAHVERVRDVEAAEQQHANDRRNDRELDQGRATRIAGERVGTRAECERPAHLVNLSCEI